MDRRDFIKTLGGAAAAMASSGGLDAATEAGERPNIIFILTDDQRWDMLGCAGNAILKTPHMDRLAADGVRFANAFVTTPICAAGRASVFTGLYERRHGFTFGTPPLAGAYTDISYPQRLREAGYRTGFVGKFGVKVAAGAKGKMFDSFVPLRGPYFKKVEGPRRHLTDITADKAIEFLRESKGGKPFCLSISFNAPHAADSDKRQYIWPAGCNDLYKDVTIPPPPMSEASWFDAQPEFVRKGFNRKRWYWRFDTPEKYQRMVKGYYRMITGVDSAVGRLRKQLRTLGLDRNTVIVLMGDNGYFLGERGFAGKWLMYEPSLRVPLIVYDPRRPAAKGGAVLEQMALNIDVAPTLLAMAGLPVPPAMQGESLMPLLDGRKTAWRTEMFCEHLLKNPAIPQSEGVRTERWKYFRYRDHEGFEELYDLTADPMEKHNLASDEAHKRQLQTLRRRCDEMIASLSKARK